MTDVKKRGHSFSTVKLWRMGVPLFLFLYYSAAFAQDAGDYKEPKNIHEVTPENVNRLRPGMEIRNIGGINMVVPEGTQYYTEGSQLKMEEAGEYAARRFKDSDERFKKLEDRIRKMEKEVQNLQEALNPHKK